MVRMNFNVVRMYSNVNEDGGVHTSFFKRQFYNYITVLVTIYAYIYLCVCTHCVLKLKYGRGKRLWYFLLLTSFLTFFITLPTFRLSPFVLNIFSI